MDALFNIVLPVFGIVFAGYLSRHYRLLGTASAEALNSFTYYIALPPLLLISTARLPITEIFNWPFIIAYMSGVALTLAIVLPFARLLFGHRDLTLLSLHGLATIFANTVYMGIPIFIAAFGQSGTTPAIVVALFGNVILIIGIVCVEFGQASGNIGKITRDVMRALTGNPLLISLIAGLGASYLELSFPKALERFFDLLAAAAGPTALFALGLSLYGQPIRGDLREISWLTIMKLLIHPLVTWCLVVYVFVIDPFWANAAVLLAALPTGTLVFVISQKYGIYVQRSAAVIMVTTMLSIITLAMLLTWLGAA